MHLKAESISSASKVVKSDTAWKGGKGVEVRKEMGHFSHASSISREEGTLWGRCAKSKVFGAWNERTGRGGATAANLGQTATNKRSQSRPTIKVHNQGPTNKHSTAALTARRGAKHTTPSNWRCNRVSSGPLRGGLRSMCNHQCAQQPHSHHP